jgi:hypothetical protein
MAQASLPAMSALARKEDAHMGRFEKTNRA